MTVEEPCDVCKGGTVELTFEYQGASAANVVIYDDGVDASQTRSCSRASSSLAT